MGGHLISQVWLAQRERFMWEGGAIQSHNQWMRFIANRQDPGPMKQGRREGTEGAVKDKGRGAPGKANDVGKAGHQQVTKNCAANRGGGS